MFVINIHPGRVLIIFVILGLLLITNTAQAMDTAAEYFQNAENYFNGEDGIERDLSEAKKWYLRSAEAGYTEAQDFVGLQYYYGKNGFEKDLKEAGKWFLKAAEGGYLFAQYRLLVCYNRGDCGLKKSSQKMTFWEQQVLKNDQTGEYVYIMARAYDTAALKSRKKIDEIVELYLTAAERGYGPAQLILANSYATGSILNLSAPDDGRNVTVLGFQEVDGRKAIYWYKKAAHQGQKEAIEILRKYYAITEFEKTGQGSQPEQLACPITDYDLILTAAGLPSGTITYRHFRDSSSSAAATCRYDKENRISFLWTTTQPKEPDMLQFKYQPDEIMIYKSQRRIKLESLTNETSIDVNLSKKEFRQKRRQVWIDRAKRLLGKIEKRGLLREATGAEPTRKKRPGKEVRKNRGPRAIMAD